MTDLNEWLDESDCPVDSCDWRYAPPPLPRPLPRGTTVEQIMDAAVGSEDDVFKALMEHLMAHGPEGAAALLRIAESWGVWDDPDVFVKSQVEGEAAMQRMGCSFDLSDLDRWVKSGMHVLEGPSPSGE